MRNWLRGKRGGLLAFLLIAGLVAGGLGWVTAAALRLEHEQLQSRAEVEIQAKLRLALWRLDSYMIPELSREASRPFSHYFAVYPSQAIDNQGKVVTPGTVLGRSPLLDAELPGWMMFHFSTNDDSEWWSPQLLDKKLRGHLGKMTKLPPEKDPTRKELFRQLCTTVDSQKLLSCIKTQEQQQRTLPVTPATSGNLQDLIAATKDKSWWSQRTQQQQSVLEYQNRAMRTTQTAPAQSPHNGYTNVYGPITANNMHLLTRPVITTTIEQVDAGPMTAFWVDAKDGSEHLMVARRVRVGKEVIGQGIVLNWKELQKLLAAEVKELFPNATLVAMRSSAPKRPEQAMTALPVELEANETARIVDPGWTPLRIGLALAWAAALVALGAVGLGGLSLINLSERRIRFVSTVTHELRTPLTTLRLYLDMLTGGMVKDEETKQEYLSTLNEETERLNRLVANVLDFSRLERQKPELQQCRVQVSELFEQVKTNWQVRTSDCNKDLIIEDQVGNKATLDTDANLVQQILANLVDNACKHTRSATDKRLWVRARLDGAKHIVLEVEDRGPGVPGKRSIFRAFRRGSDATTGGVGLGLALALRWSQLLHGQLSVHPGAEGVGACFRLRLPCQSS